MNIKDRLLELKKRIVGTYQKEFDEEDNKVIINLTEKIDKFIKWYYKNTEKKEYTEIDEYYIKIRMKNIIEKMAIWYELRFPEYEIYNLIPCCDEEIINFNDVIFRKKFIKTRINDNSKIEWSKCYSTSAFLNTLSNEERLYFSKPKYKSIVYLNPHHTSAHLHLTENGFVEMAEKITEYTNSVIKDEELKGLNIRKVVELFEERNVTLPENNELEKVIKKANNWTHQREEILNCVMYRIIERGGARIGPRRAFLFAKEFGRNIDIPMMYAVDTTDPGLKFFINEYIKSGGSKYLKCYVNYFSKTNLKEIETIYIRDLILVQNNEPQIIDLEKDEFHQESINNLLNKIEQNSLNQEKSKNKPRKKVLKY